MVKEKLMIFLAQAVRLIYSFVMVLLTPLFFVRLICKARANPAYKFRMLERLGYYSNQDKNYHIWIHAVSLGEVIAASTLVELLLAKHWKVLVTTTTPTGSNQVIKQFNNRVGHCYLPLDDPFSSKRFFKTFTFRLGLIMETELWPNLLFYSQKTKVPMILANARLSENSLKNYKKIKFFMANLLTKFDQILTQSPLDAQRFISLGAAPQQVNVAGNIKFDQTIVQCNTEYFARFKKQWGEHRTVLIAASTHQGEEEELLSVLSKLQTRIPDIMLLIAPRHPERFNGVFQLAKKKNFIAVQRSDEEEINLSTQVLIIDSLGELLGFYRMSDYAFVGGSLVAVGGHNILEPIALDVPVFTGPNMKNFSTIYNDLTAVKGITTVKDGEMLVNAVCNLHVCSEQRLYQIAQAKKLLNNHKGALKNYLEIVSAYLE